MADTADIATNLASAGVGGGLTAILARLFISNLLKRFEDIASAVTQIKEILAGIKVQIERSEKIESSFLDLSERVTYLEAKTGIRCEKS